MRDKRYLLISLLIWLITISIVTTMVCIDPTKRTVTNVYYYAVDNWYLQKDLYGDSKYLFHYLPQFVYIYLPFYHLDRPVGDALWRVFSLLIFITGIYYLINDFGFDRKEEIFLLITAIVIAPSIGAIRNGQANLTFIGICLWIMLFVMKQKWWHVAICLGILTALKQTGLIFVMLLLLIYPHLLWKVLLVFAFLLVLPFLSSDTNYVLSQYRGVISEMSGLSITEKRFADINGLLRALGFPLEGLYSLSVRALAGILTAILWVYINKKYKEPLRIILLFASATAYLMLFHPMTEQNSYVIIAPLIAFVSVFFLKKGKDTQSYALMIMTVMLGLLPEIVRPFAPDMGLWFKPLVVISFYIITSYLVISNQEA